MGQYYTGLVSDINVWLAIVTVHLSIAIVILVIIKRINEKIKYDKLTKIVSGLRKLTVNDDPPVAQACITLIRKTRISEFFDIVKHMEAILPGNLSGKLNDCIKASGKVAQIEKAAQGSRSKRRRVEAIIMLGYLKSPSALKILGKTIFDKDDDVAYFSMLSLGNIKTVDSANIILSAIKGHHFSGYKIASIIEHFPRDILSSLIKKIKDPDPDIRLWAIKLISRFKPVEYVKEITDFVKDKSSDVRAAVCDCFGEMDQESAKGPLIECLNDPVWFVRMHAARALDNILGERCISYVAGMIKDENRFLKESIQRIMAKHIKDALPYIEKFLRQENLEVRKACLEALQISGHIRKILEDSVSKDSEIRDGALGLLKAVIKAGAHFSFESSLIQYPEEMRRRMLGAIAGIDKTKAEHLDKKIKGTSDEI